MPIYNYKCTHCGATREVICKYEEREDIIACGNHWRKTPDDDRMTMVLLLSSSSFVINGFSEKNGYSKEVDNDNS